MGITEYYKKQRLNYIKTKKYFKSNLLLPGNKPGNKSSNQLLSCTSESWLFNAALILS